MAQAQTLSEFIRHYGADLDQLIDVLFEYQRYLLPEQKARLAALAPAEMLVQPRQARQDAAKFGEKFDMMAEVEAQIRLIREMRDSVYDEEGNLDVKLAKDTATSATSLLTLLNRLHEDIVNRRRLQDIEDALLESLRDAGEDVRERFFANLESRHG